MKTPTELPRRTAWGRKAVGALIAVGVALAAASPAMADGHKKNWKHHRGDNHYSHYQPYYYQQRPKVVYVQPAPVYYVQPAPVYVAPAPVYVQPAPVYVQPVPVYPRPSVSIVFPINF